MCSGEPRTSLRGLMLVFLGTLALPVASVASPSAAKEESAPPEMSQSEAVEGRTAAFEDGLEKTGDSHGEELVLVESAPKLDSLEDEEVISYLGYHGIFSERMRFLRQGARKAAEVNDHIESEKFYLLLLNMDLDEKDRRNIVLEMAEMYLKAGVGTKAAAVYEKFVERFGRDPEAATVLLRLGLIYRDLGAFRLALARFYSVLNLSLHIPKGRMETYRRLLSVRSQLEIAETHFKMGEHETAAVFFSRLGLLNLGEKDLSRVQFKSAYIEYLLEKYPTAVVKLEDFIVTYPESVLIPESHFLLVNTYKKLNQPREAVEETLKLLRITKTRKEENEKLWYYWKRRTGNQLANELYEQRDFLSALKIYQTMADLNDHPEWQWPIIYQIGLCFERLEMAPKAREAFHLLVTGVEWENLEFELTPNLISLKEMAEWRGEFDTRVSTIFEPVVL